MSETICIMNKLSTFRDLNENTAIFNSCSGCELTIFDYYELAKDEAALRAFCVAHGLLKFAGVQCPKCEQVLKVRDCVFRCERNPPREIARKYRRKRAPCEFSLGVRAGSYFRSSKKTIADIVLFTGIYFLDTNSRYVTLIEQLGISRSTCATWCQNTREVLENYLEENSSKVGGPGKHVEVIEVSVDKCGNSKRSGGDWVFVGLEREEQNYFYVPVADRTPHNLYEHIRERVAVGTTIISDNAEEYQTLDRQRCSGVANYRFMNSQNGGAPKWILGGALLSNRMPKGGLTDEKLGAYLPEAIYKQTIHTFRERMHTFWKQAARLYKPDYLTTITRPEEYVEPLVEIDLVKKEPTDGVRIEYDFVMPEGVGESDCQVSSQQEIKVESVDYPEQKTSDDTEADQKMWTEDVPITVPGEKVNTREENVRIDNGNTEGEIMNTKKQKTSEESVSLVTRDITHRDEKGNLCHFCGKSYQNIISLKKHIALIHATETPYTKTEEVDKTPKRKYPCGKANTLIEFPTPANTDTFMSAFQQNLGCKHTQ